MKIIVSLLLTASLMACGGKPKKTSTTPDNKTGTTETKTEGMGGTTYGAAKTPAPTNGAHPCGQ